MSHRHLLLLAGLCATACGVGETDIYNNWQPPAATNAADAGPTAPDAAVGSPDAAPVQPDAQGDSPDVDTTDAPNGPDAPPPLPQLRNDLTALPTWKAAVERALDTAALRQHFTDVGYSLPVGAAVYVARIVDGAVAPGYQFYDAGTGAFDMGFWPASTIKLLSALGALEWVYSHGYTGAANVHWDSGFADDLDEIYTRAIRVSSNIDYDRTLRAAGWDFMNSEFLTADRGFPRTVITGSYAGVEVRSPGGYTLREAGNSKYIMAREGVGEYGRNDTDLYELVEGVRRIMLNDEVPEAERFRIAPADVVGVQSALCSATPSYFASGAASALGGSPRICHKPGWVPDNECLDHGLVEADGKRYLVAASIPYVANCPGLAPIAEHALNFLKSDRTRVPLQPDSGDFPVQIDQDEVHVNLPAADTVVLWVDGEEVARTTENDRGHFVLGYTVPAASFVAIAGYDGDRTVAFRAGTN